MTCFTASSFIQNNLTWNDIKSLFKDHVGLSIQELSLKKGWSCICKCLFVCLFPFVWWRSALYVLTCRSRPDCFVGSQILVLWDQSIREFLHHQGADLGSVFNPVYADVRHYLSKGTDCRSVMIGSTATFAWWHPAPPSVRFLRRSPKSPRSF